MAWGDEAARFLARVLPWPASDTDAGYGNIHHTVPNKKHPQARPYFNGMAFKSVADATNHLRYINTKPETRDVYFCTSLQAQTTRSSNGKFEVAYRERSNTLGSKIIFYDLDVKAGAYPDVVTALKALGEFCKRTGMPFPSAIVGSGSGAHCYWISNRVLPPDEWQRLANALRDLGQQDGLLFDAQCTIDIVRVLRVPDTRNYKTDPFKVVKLLHLAPTDYDFGKVIIPILDKVVPRSAPVGTGQNNTALLPFDPKIFVKRAVPLIFMPGVGEASAGIGPEEVALDEKAIVQGCAFLGDALRNGGVGYDNSLWNLTLLAASFFKDGRTVAHAMSNKHHQYTFGETDSKYDLKFNEHERVGWPGCASIEANGSKVCAACPHRGKIKSPLHLGLVKKPSTIKVTEAGKEILPGYNAIVLPDDYAYNEEGVICLVVMEKDKDQDGNVVMRTKLVPLFLHQKIVAVDTLENPEAMQFEVDGSMKKMRHVYIERSIYTSSTARTLERLGEQGVAPNPNMEDKVRRFLMSLHRTAELAQASIQSKPFGWMMNDDGERDRFVYGGTTFHKNGAETPGGYIDSEMRQQFGPIGKLEFFYQMAQFVLDQKHIEFQILLASTFAGPLMQLTGQNISTLVFVGDSGVGKSTVLKIALSAWGHPDLARLQKSATENAVGHHLGVLANLPVYWDETGDPASQKSQLNIVMMDGQERKRLIARGGLPLAMRHSGSWSTLLVTCANRSLLAYIENADLDDLNATRYRIFEIRSNLKKEDLPVENQSLVDNMQDELRSNYGKMGLVYSKWLAMNTDKLKPMLIARRQAFDKMVGAEQPERFWSILCSIILIGAEIARDNGWVNFDVPAMEAYLVEQFMAQRNRMHAAGQGGADDAIELLSGFMKDHWQQVLVTDGLPPHGGNKRTGSAMPFNILKQPSDNNARGLAMQWVNRKILPILRISRLKLKEWLEQRGRLPTVIYENVPHRITDKIRLGGGTKHAAMPERVLEIDIIAGTWTADVLRDLIGGSVADDPQPEGKAA